MRLQMSHGGMRDLRKPMMLTMRRIRWLFAVSFVLCLVGRPVNAGDVCLEEEGHRQFEVEDWERAYEMLRPCESVPGASGTTFYRLAVLVREHRQGTFVNSSLRKAKEVGLLLLSSLEGHADGIAEFAEALEVKARVLDDADAERMANCFRSSLTKAESTRGRHIKRCLR